MESFNMESTYTNFTHDNLHSSEEKSQTKWLNIVQDVLNLGYISFRNPAT